MCVCENSAELQGSADPNLPPVCFLLRRSSSCVTAFPFYILSCHQTSPRANLRTTAVSALKNLLKVFFLHLLCYFFPFWCQRIRDECGLRRGGDEALHGGGGPGVTGESGFTSISTNECMDAIKSEKK